jgi:hypothetical protein
MARFIETGDAQRAQARRDEGIRFQEWLQEVDGHLEATIGLGHRDLPDQTWRDWFEDQVDPAEAAEYALDNEGLL